MAESATGKLEKQDFALEPEKQNLSQSKAEGKPDAKLFQNSNDALLDDDLVDSDQKYLYYEASEDADDEISTDDDYAKILPLNIKKVETGKTSDQVHLSTDHPEQTTQIAAHVQGLVKWADKFPQAQEDSAEASHIAPTASDRSLKRAPTPYPEALSVQPISDLLHPSPPLRRRKGSMALRKNTSDSAAAHSMMSKTGEAQDGPYGHDQGHDAETSPNSNSFLTPTHRSKILEARGTQNAFSGQDQRNTAEIGQSSGTSTSSENLDLKHKTTDFRKAMAVSGYGEEDRITPTKSMTNLVTSPKASHGKNSLRKLFHRKGSKEPTTPPSSSGKTAGRMTISAPTLIDASPGAEVLLKSAPSLVDPSPGANKIINYSRPIAPHSPSDGSNGSPNARGRSSFALSSSNPTSGPSTRPEGLDEKSGNILVGLETSLIHECSHASAVRGYHAANEHGVNTDTLATEKNPDDADSDSFNPSDYSGDENSVQQAVAIPIVFRGKAKLVDVRPPRGTTTAISGNQSGVSIAIAPSTAQLTDHDAEVLGAQDAERYAMTSQTRATTITTDDPFIDPAYQNLLAKPANEIAAKEMTRIKAAREAGNMGGGLMERMNALLAKSEAKPGAEKIGNATASPRTITSESLLSKMRARGKGPKKAKEPDDSEEEVIRKVQAAKERGLREEKEINAMIKAKLAAKDAANGEVRGAGIPRIDYGPPNLRTALGGCGPTDEERAQARTVAERRAAELAAGRIKNHGDNTTVRGRFEGY